MRKFIVIAAIFNIVISAKGQGKVDDQWIWGYEGGNLRGNNPNDKHGRIQSTEPPVKGTTEFNPCLIKDPETPNFRPSGRRISEAKFHEYMWNIYIKEFRNKRDGDCNKYHGHGDYAVIGGRKALWGEFPHMGAIGWKKAVGEWSFKCGSTLISPNFVLTAAHCTKVPSSDTTVADTVPKIVRFVDLHQIKLKTDRYIFKIIVHPEYKPPNQTYDIALMRLVPDVYLSTLLHPACLWNSFDTSSLGTKAILTGWGATKAAPGPVTTSQTLQTGEVDIIDSTTCDELLRPFCNRNQCGVEDHQMCAGLLSGGVDTCQGDSGGPLQVKIPSEKSLLENTYYVIGVTSYGFGCALENSPGVYTRVSSFIDWIEGIVWPE